MVGYAHRGGFTVPEPGPSDYGPFQQRIDPRFDPRTALVRPPLWLKVTAIVVLLAGIGLTVLAAAAGFVILLLLIPVFLVLWVIRAITVRTAGTEQRHPTDGRQNVRVLGRDEP